MKCCHEENHAEESMVVRVDLSRKRFASWCAISASRELRANLPKFTDVCKVSRASGSTTMR